MTKTLRKHSTPSFLAGVVSSDVYERWLEAKARAHVRRDRKRGYSSVSRQGYKEAIHAAVLTSNGVDAYTGEQLHWHLIGTYDNEQSKSGRHKYKAGLALLPTVDHWVSGATKASFRICAWRTNDAKNDLPLEEFVQLCAKVVARAGKL